MIKRPLVWVLGAYMAGMYMAWGSISINWVILLMLLTCLVLYLLMFQVPKKYINRHDNFLWFLPLLLLLGFCVMKDQKRTPSLDLAFQDKAECSLVGTVTQIVPKKSFRVLYLKKNTITLASNKKYFCENVIVYCSDQQKYLIGNEISVIGEIQKFSEASNPGQFNEKFYYSMQRINYKIFADSIRITGATYSGYHAILSGIKQKMIQVYDTILSSKEAGVINAMLLGENALLDDRLRELYQENGISHILSISGLHISLIGMFVFCILKKCRVPIILSSVLSIVFIYSYGLLTNFSVSTNRSVVMMILLLFGQMIGKTYDMISAAALGALLILLNQPLQIMNAGFLLSFAAVLGIAVILPCFRILFPKKNRFWQALFVSISAQVLTLPFILFFFYQFPTYSIIINLLLVPVASILLITAMVAGIAGIICLPAGVFCVGGASCILKYYEWICQWGSRLPGNMITTGKPGGLRIILYFLLLGFFVWKVNHEEAQNRKRRMEDKKNSNEKCNHNKFENIYGRDRGNARNMEDQENVESAGSTIIQKDRQDNCRIWLLLPVAGILLMFLPFSKDGLTITMLDVGQGDAIFMETETGRTYLIDGGSSDVKQVGTYRLMPFLLSRGVDRIDYAFVTHSDQDHISGLMELMEKGRIKISHLILPDIDAKEEAYKKLVAFAGEKKVPVQYIKAGDQIRDGKMKLLCLHPFPEEVYLSANAYSTVLSISYGSFDMLLTGDLEGKGEGRLTEIFQNPKMRAEYGLEKAADYDILKVAHHGSKNATLTDFLNLTKPDYAVISCGEDNSYGHPHEELLERLRKIGSSIVITKESGAVTIETDGQRMSLHKWK